MIFINWDIKIVKDIVILTDPAKHLEINLSDIESCRIDSVKNRVFIKTNTCYLELMYYKDCEKYSDVLRDIIWSLPHKNIYHCQDVELDYMNVWIHTNKKQEN